MARIFWQLAVLLGRLVVLGCALLLHDDATVMLGAIFFWLVCDWIDRDEQRRNHA